MQKESRIASVNEQIINALEREGHIDLKSFVSCLPQVELKRKTSTERDPGYTGSVQEGEDEYKPRYVLEGMSELK